MKLTKQKGRKCLKWQKIDIGRFEGNGTKEQRFSQKLAETGVKQFKN